MCILRNIFRLTVHVLWDVTLVFGDGSRHFEGSGSQERLTQPHRDISRNTELESSATLWWEPQICQWTLCSRGARICSAQVELCVPQKEAVLLLFRRALLDCRPNGTPTATEDGENAVRRRCRLEHVETKIAPAISKYMEIPRPGSRK